MSLNRETWNKRTRACVCVFPSDYVVCFCVCVLTVRRLLFITSHIKIMIKLSLPVIEALTSDSPILPLPISPNPPPTVAFPLLFLHPPLSSSPTLPSLSTFQHHHTTFFPTPSLQVEHPRPAGGVAEPLRGAGVPAQRDRRQPSPHGPSGQSTEPAAGAPGPTARHAQTQPAPAQRYDCHTQSHVSRRDNYIQGIHRLWEVLAPESGTTKFSSQCSCCWELGDIIDYLSCCAQVMRFLYVLDLSAGLPVSSKVRTVTMVKECKFTSVRESSHGGDSIETK